MLSKNDVYLQPIFVSLSRIHKYVSQDQLPVDLGGLWTYSHEQWIHNRVVSIEKVPYKSRRFRSDNNFWTSIVEGRRVHQMFGKRRVRYGKAETAPDEQSRFTQTQHGRHRADRVRREVQRSRRSREKGVTSRPDGVPAYRQNVCGPWSTVPAGRSGHQRGARSVYANRPR